MTGKDLRLAIFRAIDEVAKYHEKDVTMYSVMAIKDPKGYMDYAKKAILLDDDRKEFRTKLYDAVWTVLPPGYDGSEINPEE